MANLSQIFGSPNPATAPQATTWSDLMTKYGKPSPQNNPVPTTWSGLQAKYQNWKPTSQSTPPSSPFSGISSRPSFTGVTGNQNTAQSTPSVNTGLDTLGLVKNIGQGMISSEAGAGQDIGAAIGGKSYVDKFSKLSADQQKDITSLVNLRNKYAKAGDTANLSRINTMIQNENVAGTSLVDMFPALDKSNEQILGDFAGVGLDVVTAGQIGPELKAGEEATDVVKGATAVKRITQGAKTGAILGSGYGLAGGAQANETPRQLAYSTALGAGTGAITGGTLGGIFGARPQLSDEEKIQDTIAPQLDKRETQAALEEGRITHGKKTISGKQLPDVVAHSDATIQAADTIKKTIPKAANMDDVQLYSALSKKTESTAKDLQSDMQKVEIKQSSLASARDAWNDLKISQTKDPNFQDFKAGNTQFQKNFEARLNTLNRDITDEEGKFKAPTKQTLDEWWDARKSFDNSIPPNVKNATDASPANLQYRKAMWLEDRRIFNDVINNSKSGLGEKSQQTFSDMSDMYDAQNNIKSKVKVDLKGNPVGRFGQFMQKHPIMKHLVKGTVGAAAGYGAGAVTGSDTGKEVGSALGVIIGSGL